jgi:hypothetical protein
MSTMLCRHERSWNHLRSAWAHIRRGLWGAAATRVRWAVRELRTDDADGPDPRRDVEDDEVIAREGEC